MKLTKGGRRIMKPKAFIYGEQPHKELSIHEVPLWSFNDKDNVHEIENWKQMAEEIVATRGSLNNHLIYSQEDYPGIINDASIEHVAMVSHIKYDEDTKTFIADITSTNQQFIELIAETEYFPRVHPCYEAETNRISIGGSTTVSSTFKRLLCWLVEPAKNKTELSIEYHPEGKSDESNNNDIDDNEKTDLCETKISEEDSYFNLPISKIALRAIMEKHITNILSDSITDDGKDGWNYGERYNIFYWRIHTKTTILQIGAQISFDYENQCWTWEIHTHNSLNVNMRIYKDRIDLFNSKESCYDDFSYEFIKILQGKISDYMTRLKKAHANEDKEMTEQDEERSQTKSETNRWETMRAGINATLDSFCDTLIANSIVGGSYKKSGSLRRITLGEKTIDVILEFDTDLDSWLIFIGDPTKPRIVVNANEHIVADISAFIPDPLCMKDIQTLCDMLGVCRNNNWQVKEDTHEEQMESCETSEDKEDVSKLIPKEELMKIIFENIKGILENDLSKCDKYPGKYHRNSWSLTTYEDLFRYAIFDRQRCMSKSIGCNLNKDHWEIYIDKASNVNIVVYPDEACWMTDALLFRTPNKDFPKDVLENIITDINAWIKTKTMPNKELSAFSQSLIKDGKRPTKEEYYLAMAEVASTRGTCLRRRYGSVIVKDDRIVSTGYAGAPSGRQNCCDIGYCRREKLNAQRGTMYHLCRSIHSEQNAIINASKEEMKGATLYLAGVNIADGSIVKNADCCSMCKRFIINSGISRVIIKDPEKPEGYRAIDVSEWVSNDDSLDVEVGY